MQEDVRAPYAHEIVTGDESGGANTSHTIVVAALGALLTAVPGQGTLADYEYAAIELNVLGKSTQGARRRTFRYLRELYGLRPTSLLFRALRDLWADEPACLPLLAGVSALARDPVFRASSSAILESSPGDSLTSGDLARAVEEDFSERYSASTLAKIGRNTFSSWEQTGHLAPDKNAKIRRRATCRPGNVAYSLLLGHLQGLRGQALFETLWSRVLDHPKSHLYDLAYAASQRGLLEFRHSGGVMEVGFKELLRPVEGQLT